MDKNIQQAMLPGSVAWFMPKKPVRILGIISIIMTVLFVAFSFWIIIDQESSDNLTGMQILFIFVYLFAWLTVAIIASMRSSQDKAVYIKENGYMFRIIPTPNAGSGAMYGGIAGGLIGAAIGAAIDSASGGNVAVGGGVLGMAHTKIGLVSQVAEVLQIEDKDNEYLVSATLIQYLNGGKTAKPRKQKMHIDKRIIAVDSLMAELGAIHSRSL